jgi:hypothetical protein
MESTKEQLHRLVDRLSDERAEDALSCVRRLVEIDGEDEEGASAAPNRRPEPPLMSGHELMTQPKRSWEELAAEQGVKPIASIDDLGADFWPEDESIDEFIAAVREWRGHG